MPKPATPITLSQDERRQLSAGPVQSERPGALSHAGANHPAGRRGRGFQGDCRAVADQPGGGEQMAHALRARGARAACTMAIAPDVRRRLMRRSFAPGCSRNSMPPRRAGMRAGMDACWPRRCGSARIGSGGCCAPSASVSNGGAVGAFPPIRSLPKRRPMWSAFTWRSRRTRARPPASHPIPFRRLGRFEL